MLLFQLNYYLIISKQQYTVMEQAKLAKVLSMFLPGKWFYTNNKIEASAMKDLISDYFKEGADQSSIELPGCSSFHDNHCNVPQLVKAIGALKMSGKMYLIVHLIPLLLYKRKKLRTEPVQTVAKFLFGWIKSVLFISFYALISRKGWCYLLQDGAINRRKFVLINFIATFGILFEAASRQGEITMYVLPRYFESIPIYLGKMKLMPQVPKGANLLLGLAMALTAHCYFTDVGSIKPHIRWLVSLIAGERGEDQREETLKTGQKASFAGADLETIQEESSQCQSKPSESLIREELDSPDLNKTSNLGKERGLN